MRANGPLAHECDTGAVVIGGVVIRSGLLAAMVASAAMVGAVGTARGGNGIWTTAGPAGGTVRALEVRPANPQHLLAAVGAGGIFRSTDGGVSWARTLGLPRDTLGFSISYAASEPDVVYAGTGGGAQRSDDGGQTWAPVYDFTSVSDIEADPYDPDTVFLTNGAEQQVSFDGGLEWTQVDYPAHGLIAIRDIAAAPSVAGRFYLAGPGVLARTDDRGGDWHVSWSAPGLTAIAVDRHDADRLFGVTHSDGVWRSTDAGMTWEQVSNGLPRGEHGSLLPINAVEIDPVDGDVIYIGAHQGGRLFRTIDGGEIWAQVPTGLSRHGVTEIEVEASDPDRLIVGFLHDGIGRSVDAGQHWIRATRGAIGSDVKSLLVVHGSNATVLAGTVGQGIFRTTDAGTTWASVGLRGQTVLGLASGPSQPDVVYAAASRGLYRSRDAGLTWSRLRALGARHLRDVAVSPVDPRILYAIQFEWTYRSLDRGASWQVVRQGTFMSVTAHPTRARVAYLGSRASLARTRNAGDTWQTLFGGGFYDVRDVAIHPRRPWILLAAVDSVGFLRSRNRGVTWKAVATRHLGVTEHAHAIVFDRAHPSRAYAAGFDVLNGGAVLRSNDRGVSWHRVSRTGMTTTWVASLALSGNGNRLYAGTTGFGLDDGGGAFAWRYP